MKVVGNFSENDPIMIRINQVVEEMKEDKNLGDFIKKKPWPRKYIKLHDASNLYKLNIGDSHRLIYTVRGLTENKQYQLLDLLTHKEYDVLFGYSTS
jgi:hypothetical protein